MGHGYCTCTKGKIQSTAMIILANQITDGSVTQDCFSKLFFLLALGAYRIGLMERHASGCFDILYLMT